MAYVQRPKENESDEDLLKFQEDFLRSHSKSSASVYRVDSKGKGTIINENTNASKKTEENLEKHDTHISKILSDIIEKDVSINMVSFPSHCALNGFPMPLHRDVKSDVKLTNNEKAECNSSRKSLFAQQCAQNQKTLFGIASNFKQNQDFTERATAPSIGNINSSLIVGTGLNNQSWQQESQKIHEENVARLSSLSESEILEEQSRLLKMLDPSLIEFIRNKQKPSSTIKTETTLPALNNTSSCNIPEYVTEETRKTCLHMDIIESDKMEWMKDLPQNKLNATKLEPTARFDLNGKLIMQDKEIPVNTGLYHHGNEPDRAGYSLEEIFNLSRSANLQQRSLAIGLLGKIFFNEKQGLLVGSLSMPVTASIVESGGLFLLRWSLDEQTESGLTAAIQALHALLTCPQDEDAADLVYWWPRGNILPELRPVVQSSEEAEDEENKNVISQLMRKDIVKALLQMSFLPRIRYILEVFRPQSVSAICQLLDILCRICRHSTEAAFEVWKCPRLIQTLFSDFITHELPKGSEQVSIAKHVSPTLKALKVIRLICSAGRNLATSLIKDWHLLDVLMKVIIELPQNKYAEDLCVESLTVWCVFLHYGLTQSWYRELYPTLVNHLTISLRDMKYTNLAIALLKVMQAAIDCTAPRNLSDSSSMELDDSLVVWSYVEGLLEIIWPFIENNAKLFVANQLPDTRILATSFDVVATYFTRQMQQQYCNSSEALNIMERFSSTIIHPLVSSSAFDKILSLLRPHSVRLAVVAENRSQALESNPEFGSLLGGQSIPCPVIDMASPFHLILATLKLIYTFGTLHKSLPDKLYKICVEHNEVKQYLRRLHESTQTFLNSFFLSFENYLQYLLIKMASIIETSEKKLYHETAIVLLNYLQSGDEVIAHDLLSTVIFNPALLGADSIVSSYEAKENISPNKTSDQMRVAESGLISDALVNLPSIRAVYIELGQTLISTKKLQQSYDHWTRIPWSVESMLCGYVGQLLVPRDWIYLAIVHFYNLSTQVKTSGAKEQMPRDITTICNSIQWIYLLETCRPFITDTISMATRISRLLCIFIGGSDVFLDSRIQKYLMGLLSVYCQPRNNRRLNLHDSIPGLTSFYDLYLLVLSQYEAVSFGDSLFSNFVLLPLQQCHDVTFRRLVWSEHGPSLMLMRLPLTELIVPIESLLEPEEKDVGMVRLYCQAILSDSVTSFRSPVPYLIAIHHVNRFIYNQQPAHSQLRMEMVRQVLKSQNTVMSHQLLYYKKARLIENCGMELYAQLPTTREKWLQSLQKR